jgi:hypothetical protein
MRLLTQTRIALALALLCGSTGTALAQALDNSAFQIRFDATGIRSLKRASDVHDTDYIAANGSLGRLLVRYRATRNGDWRELRDMLLRAQSGQSIEYEMGRLLPTLAQRASPIAERGVGGLRALSDGLVPPPPDAAGRGRGAPPSQAAAAHVPTFSWTPGANEPGGGGIGVVGPRRWVQYTFASPEEISRTQVYWVEPPQQWRLLYQDGAEWKEVQPRAAYSVAPNAMATVEFAPVKTIGLRVEVTMPSSGGVSLAEWAVGPDAVLAPADELGVTQKFDLQGDLLEWTVTLANRGRSEVEVTDLAVPLAFAERTGARGDIYTKKLLRHSLVNGHGSWVYWQRSNGVGPYLVMIPTGQSKFEYQDSAGGAFTPYIHAKQASAVALAAGGTWRLPISDLKLTPAGTAGSTRTYTFRFRWARDFAGVRDALFEEGKLDTVIAPGMVVPSDLPAMISLRTKQSIAAVEPEHAGSTKVEFVGDKGQGAKVYRVQFSKLGENMLKVRYGNGQWASLEFFVTEPLETVIKKRAKFLVTHHQHKDPSKWYHGVYSDWDQKNEILRSPEDRDNLSAWLTDANDDAGNARPAYVASKNVFFPDQDQIDSLELYISKYLWGGMQMTDKEKYPYAIYGIPNFMANRSSPDEGRNGQAHVWRIYDYPHIVMLYFRMYHIATFYPSRVKYLDAAGYLERAYRTAVAYWTVPIAIEKWSADAVGTMNEAFIPELIDTLEREGKAEWAKTLRGHWEGKVDRFVNRTPNLYGSEFAFDSTGFESTGSFAKYALTRDPEFRRKVSLEAAKKFSDFQLLLNVSDRGWLETTYYQVGSDYRGNLTYLLSYMSQMGGWSILQHALHFAEDPTDYLRLGYASTLSSWALVNSGTKESGYGYWFPGLNNDGATGGGFMPDARGRAWIGKEVPRGAWYYSAEEDVGYCGALRSHATIVARDPIFGDIAYGGLLTRAGTTVSVIPRDGLRVRFHVVRDKQRLHLILDHDGFAKEKPVVVSDDLSSVAFALENRTGGAHETGLTIAGLPNGHYTVSVGGKAVATIEGKPAEQVVKIPVGSSAETAIRIARRKTRLI